MLLFLDLLFPLILYSILTSLVYLVTPLSSLLSTTIGAVLTMPFLCFMYHKDQKRRFISLNSSIHLPLNPAYLIFLGIGACIVVNNTISLSGLAVLFPGFEAVAEDLYNPPLMVQLFATVLIIPAVEEMIFRGLSFAPIRDRLGFWPAAVISSLIFAIYHGNVVQGVYAFVLGMIMAWLYEKCRTILAPYLFHMAANLTSVCVTNTGLRIMNDPNYMTIFAISIMTAACLMVFCFVRISRNIKVKEEKV